MTIITPQACRHVTSNSNFPQQLWLQHERATPFEPAVDAVAIVDAVHEANALNLASTFQNG